MTLSGTHLLVELAPACASWGSGEHDYVGFWNLFREREDCYGVATVMVFSRTTCTRRLDYRRYMSRRFWQCILALSIGAMAAFDELLLMSDLIVM